MTASALAIGPGEDLSGLRDLLESEGFSEERLRRLMSFVEGEVALDPVALELKTRAGTRFDVLLRLFFLARSEPREQVVERLTRPVCEQLLRLGVLREEEGALYAEGALIPMGPYYLIRDFWPNVSQRKKRTDYALGVGKATLNLADHTVRREGERVLDLGTGTGFQALLASEHAASVVGTDTNERALSFARFNAAINGRTSIETRAGSLYDPVREDSFDLIVANPPFVISPDTQYVYRDSGLPRDQISELVLRGAAQRLVPGTGMASVIFNWYSRAGEEPETRPREWISGSACDAYLLRLHEDEPLDYASTWLRSAHGEDHAAYRVALERWLAAYDAEGMHRFHWGVCVLRKRATGEPWFRFEDKPALDRQGSCSAQLLRRFGAEDLLRGTPEDLMSARLRLTDDHVMEMRLEQRESRFQILGQSLRQTVGYPYTGNLDTWVAGLVEACNGERALSRIIEEKAREHGLDLAELREQSEQVFRALLRLGYFEIEAS